MLPMIYNKVEFHNIASRASYELYFLLEWLSQNAAQCRDCEYFPDPLVVYNRCTKDSDVVFPALPLTKGIASLYAALRNRLTPLILRHAHIGINRR
jgi:hypothetical protein